MKGMELTQDVIEKLEGYKLPQSLGFGRELAPIMYRADYKDETWHMGQIIPFSELRINPAATSVQFGQQCFEGMKAYNWANSSPHLFRPEFNFSRFKRSASRLCMPPVTPEIFADALSKLTMALENFIPNQSGQSLYLRPTLLGLDHTFAVQSSDTYCFILLASPSDAYFTKSIKVMIEREDSRAANGGTGSVKVGGNYASSLRATKRCNEAGFDQPLWLDAATHHNIEELSGMNFMALINGELHTPELSDTILAGGTRSSLLQIAHRMGIKTVERVMPITGLLKDIERGVCTEIFACGTAAIICPIQEIGEEKGAKMPLLDVNKMSLTFKESLLDIQEGHGDDPFGWTISADDPDQLYSRFLCE
ncbi:MAG: branched-chain amino acid aminotransferase [Sphingomonadales bacterium]